MQVRGKEVKFDRTTLNHFYSLKDIDNDEYRAYLIDHMDLAEVTNTIYKLGTQEKISNREAYSVKANVFY